MKLKKLILVLTISMLMNSYCPLLALNPFTKTVSNIFHATFDRNKGFQTTFKRSEGYWSKPLDEANTEYFKRLAEPETQREDWYKVTPYISEFYCGISNIPLILVGAYHGSPETIFAGLASLAYHSCPKQWLLHLDRVGVALAFSKGIREYKVVQENPKLLAIPAAIALMNGADVYLGQYKGQTWPHVAWHLSAAVMAHIFLSAIKK